METAQIISIAVSILAFLLSLVATTVSLVRKKFETNRAIRNELTDVLSELTKLSLEHEKLTSEKKNEPAYVQKISSIMNQRNAMLMQQAIFLVEQIPKIVGSVDYNTIAFAHANAGDLIIAERFYRKAIEASKENAYYKALAMRSFAHFLFAQRRFEEARGQYTDSISLLHGGDDLVRYTNGFTYQSWGWNEMNLANSPNRAIAAFESALNEFNGISNPILRQQYIDTLTVIMQPLKASQQHTGMASPT